MTALLVAAVPIGVDAAVAIGVAAAVAIGVAAAVAVLWATALLVGDWAGLVVGDGVGLVDAPMSFVAEAQSMKDQVASYTAPLLKLIATPMSKFVRPLPTAALTS